MKPNRIFEHDTAQKFLRALRKYKYILIVVLAGVFLLLLPPLTGTEDVRESADANLVSFREPVSVTELEDRMEEVLSQIEGAGQVRVVLSMKTGTEQILARDIESSRSTEEGALEQERKSAAVILSRGSGMENTIVVKQVYPEYRGAAIVCAGADNARVQLSIMESVSALTGLGTDRISISKMKER